MFRELENLENRKLFSAALSAGTLSILGTIGNDNITVSLHNNNTKVRVNDNGVVRDFVASAVNKVVASLLSGNDTFMSFDTVKKPMQIFAGGGNDVVYGGYRNDSIFGEEGNDFIDGRKGDDDLNGGDGVDTVDYSDRLVPLWLRIDNLANDGIAGAHDNIRTDIENINGGQNNDYIVGSSSANVIQGLAGNDTITTNGGYDYIYGQDGDDYLFGTGGSAARFSGGNGNDFMSAASAAAGINWMYGEDGNDTIRPGGFQTVAYGGAGNDDINSYCSNTTWAYGGDGNDVLYGGYGQNVLHGDAGDDLVKGYGSSTNWVYGDDGNDKVYANKSGTGQGIAYGGNGNDQVFGGRGNDWLFGDAGDDILVSIGGGQFDTLNGGAGLDSFWMDAEATEKINNSNFVDALLEGLVGTAHRVSSFARGVSRELLGQNLADPTDSGTTTNVYSQPLFASGGPTKEDIRQGGIGNCGTMATMAAIAKTNPMRIKQSVVDLGDGTFAVQFFSGGSPSFVRVDADMPSFGCGNGQENSIWTRVMEKAFATFRSNTFASTASRWMSDVFRDFGRSPIESWSFSSGADFLNQVKAQLDAGRAVTVSTPYSTILNGASLVGGHAYTVVSVNLNYLYLPFGGRILIGGSMTLRNPWGTDGAGADGSNDGLVTIGMNQIMGNFVTIQSASV